MEYIFIKCGNCDRNTCLLLKVTNSQINDHYIFVKYKISSCGFVLDNFFKQADETWYIYINYLDWLNKGPQYNTAKMLGLKAFITIIKL